MGNHETMEVTLNGHRFRAEERKRGWFLMEFWDDTVIAGEEFGWVFLLPDEQKRIERNRGGYWVVAE